MLFTSPVFLLAFLPLTFAGFVAIERIRTPAAIVPWLLFCSMVFYAWWSPRFLLLLMVSTIVNWVLGRAIARQKAGRRRLALIAGLAWNLGLLGFFKYTDFVIENLDNLANTNWALPHIVLPLGISFFTFQKIAYLVDMHRGHAKPSRFLDFALFVFFFPQLIAGPIVHHSEIMPQLRAIAGSLRGKEEFWSNLAVGMTLLLIGLVKKVVVADQFALYATPVFTHAASGASVAFLESWQGALAYSVQLYFDFSGYSDMAIGLARLFGVRLPANFNAPYRALTIIDFWRRWHMTLSRFLRDYLYIPLGGNRKGPSRRNLNVMIVMLLGGMWHGAGWTFLLWGALHGLYLLVAHGWQSWGWAKLPAPAAWALTMIAVVVAWVVFRAPDLASAGDLILGMSGLHGIEPSGARQPMVLVCAAAGAAMLAGFIVPNSIELMRDFDPVIGGWTSRDESVLLQDLAWRPSAVSAALWAFALLMVVMLSFTTSTFLYFQF